MRYHVNSPSAAHERLVAYVLAYLADEDGECTVSRAELCAYTCLNATVATHALHRLVDDGLLELVRAKAPNGPSLHRLLRCELESRQMDAVVRREGLLDVLLNYDVPVKLLHVLNRAGLTLLSDLGERVDEYRASPTAMECGFDVFLKYKDDMRGMGPKMAVALLDAYDRWASESLASPSGSATTAT
jgi:hypothetical protein